MYLLENLTKCELVLR